MVLLSTATANAHPLQDYSGHLEHHIDRNALVTLSFASDRFLAGLAHPFVALLNLFAESVDLLSQNQSM